MRSNPRYTYHRLPPEKDKAMLAEIRVHFEDGVYSHVVRKSQQDNARL